jgi:hypothetical protein
VLRITDEDVSNMGGSAHVRIDQAGKQVKRDGCPYVRIYAEEHRAEGDRIRVEVAKSEGKVRMWLAC